MTRCRCLRQYEKSNHGAVLHAGSGTAAGPTPRTLSILQRLRHHNDDGSVIVTAEFLEIIA